LKPNGSDVPEAAPEVEPIRFAPAASGLERVPLWLLWAIANALPLVAVPLLTSLLQAHLGSGSLAAVAYPTTFALLALAQGLALERSIDQPVLWIAATVLGSAVGCASGAAVLASGGGGGRSELALVMSAHALGGTVGGAAQALVLRRGARRALLWMTASGAAAALCAGIWFPFWADSWLPGYASGRHAGGNELTTILRAAATSGIVTGPLLERLLRRRRPGRP